MGNWSEKQEIKWEERGKRGKRRKANLSDYQS